MIRQITWIAGRTVIGAVIGGAIAVFANSYTFNNAFDYEMTRDEQASIIRVSGDIILGSAINTMWIAAFLSLGFGVLELGYWVSVGKQKEAEAQEKLKHQIQQQAAEKLKNPTPLTDDQLLEFSFLSKG